MVRPQHPLLLFPGYARALHGTKSDVLITPLACLQIINGPHFKSNDPPRKNWAGYGPAVRSVWREDRLGFGRKASLLGA